jgi:hypothetical protein
MKDKMTTQKDNNTYTEMRKLRSGKICDIQNRMYSHLLPTIIEVVVTALQNEEMENIRT